MHTNTHNNKENIGKRTKIMRKHIEAHETNIDKPEKNIIKVKERNMRQ